MPGDKQRCVLHGWQAGEGVLLHDPPGAGQQRAGHARVRADCAAVVQRLPAVLADAPERLVIFRPKAKFEGQHFLREITFADEQRHDEDTPGRNAAQHAAHAGLLLEEPLPHLGEQSTRTQFSGVLACRLRRAGVSCRAVRQQDKCAV